MTSELNIGIFEASKSPDLMALAWRLRHRVFVKDLGWAIPEVDLMEMDEFDRHATHCGVLYRNRMVGYWRCLPTIQPYLLEASFGSYFTDLELPHSPDIWEVSRFALDATLPPRDRRRVGCHLVEELKAFGLGTQARKFIGLTEPGFARFLERCGLPLTYLTPTVIVGTTSGLDPVSALVVEHHVEWPHSATARAA